MEFVAENTFFGSLSAEVIDGTQRADLVLGLQGSDRISGGLGDDYMYGNQGADLLNGNRGSDTVFGGQNNDTVRGGKDDDLLFGDKGDDTLYGDLGNDTVLGMDGNDLVFGNGGSDLLNGNLGNDTVDGGEGNDTLRGGKDNDSLFGAGGDDIIYGDLGIDTLTGGAGSDTFIIGQGADGDVIADYTDGEDVLEFANGLTLAQVAQVNIVQGTGENASNTLLENRDSGEILAILQGVDSSIFAAAGLQVQNSGDLPIQIPDLTGSGGAVSIFPSARIAPTDGKEMVNLTRETIVRFRDRIDPNTLDDRSFYLIANGERVPGRIDVSSTNQFATFYYNEPLPASTEVRVVVDGDRIAGADGVALDVDGDGNPGGMLTAYFRTLPLTQIEGTDVYGYVFDSFNKNSDGSDRPIVGATISLDALPNVTAVTDENGFFTLENVPAPEFFVHIDGRTATNAPEGTVYATVGKPFHSVPGQSVQLEKNGEPFDIYLPPMAEADLQELSPTEDTEVGFGEAGKAQLEELFPDIDPSFWDEINVTFPANSARDDSGSPATQAAIIPVAPDRLPAPLPGELDPQLVISIQAEGATTFDVPAPVTFPNLEGLLPGQQSLIFSFNHDAGEWEVIGTGRVSSDGRSIVSDEGVGILAPGWHFVQPGTIVNGSIGLIETERVFLAFENQNNGFITRITSNADGKFSQVLSPNTSYKIYAYDATSNLTGVTEFSTGSSGTVSELPSIVLSDPPPDDMDGEGLADIAEVAIGTSENNADTDDDGIDDLAEVQQELDPLGDRAFPTGIIASLPLQGEAKAVVVEGSNIGDREQIAYLATGSHGFAIVDTSEFDNPIVLGQLDLPGDATDVAVDSNLQLAALATNNGGLQLVDISDPMEPKVSNSLSLSANQVEIANGIAYVASGNNGLLVSVDLFTGSIIEERKYAGGQIQDMAVSNTSLYTVLRSGTSPHTVNKIDISGSLGEPVDTLTIEERPTFGRLHIAAGGGLVYVGAIDESFSRQVPGVTIISDTDEGMSLVGPPSDITAFDVAPNGSGLVVFTGANNLSPSQADIGLLDTSDPTQTDRFLTSFATPGGASDIAIASGIAFVADGSAGLQVINYLPFDNQGEAPTVNISSSVADEDPDTPGIQVIEGSTIIPIATEVSDDVQVSNLELLFNGEVVGNDVSFPFEFSALAPYIGDGPNTLTAQVRATDTGGNSSLSNELTFELSEDVFPPVVSRTFPTEGKLLFNKLPISIFFNEKIDASSIDLSGISLTYLGADETLGGGDDEIVALESVQTPSEERISIVPENPLPIGNHQLVIQPSVIADLAGNPLESSFTLDFSTFEVPEDAVVWISESDGDWNDPNNWSTGTVPGADDVVIIDFPGAEPTITISSDVAVGDLRSEESILITGSDSLSGGDSLPGNSLTVNGKATVNNQFTLEKGGGLIVSGTEASLFANGSVELEDASLLAENGGNISLSTATSYTLTGSSNYYYNYLRAEGPDSILDLPALESITSGDEDFSYSSLSVEASNGGRVNLSKVTEISQENEADYGYISLSVDGTDSTIGLDSLTSLSGVNLRASNGGTLAAPTLTSYTHEATYYYYGVNGLLAEGPDSLLDLPALTSITSTDDDFSYSDSPLSVSASDGGRINLSAVTEILQEGVSENGHILLHIDGADSIIDLAGLTSVTGASLSAINGGTLAAPALISYTYNGNYNNNYYGNYYGNYNDSYYGSYYGNALRAEGAGSVLDLPSLETVTSTEEELSYSYLSVSASDGGSINLSKVTEISQEEGAKNGYVSLYVDGADSKIDLAALTSVTGASFIAFNSATLAAPALTSYTYNGNYNGNYNGSYYGDGLRAEGADSVLDFPSLETITSTEEELSYYSLSVSASNGGRINLSEVTQISQDEGSESGRISLSVNGTDSTIDLTALTSLTGVSLTAYNGAVLELPAVTSLSGVSLAAYNGANLIAPALESYTYKGNFLSRLLADGASSVLDLPTLKIITLTDTLTDSTDEEPSSPSVQASNGGRVNLDTTNEIIVLPDESDAEVTFDANGTDSIINALDLLSSAAAFTATAGGTIVLKDKTIEV